MDQSSIHHNETEYNMDDQIGYLIPINQNMVMALTTEAASFILFTYTDGQGSKPTSQTLKIQNEVPLTGVR
jgi:hypothetical protein